MSRSVYDGGVLRERWDDVTRLYTRWNPSGLLVETRPYTTAENAEADATAAAAAVEANGKTLTDRAIAALGNNTTFLAVTTPTNAQIAAQVKALTRQSSALIRTVFGQLDSTD